MAGSGIETVTIREKILRSVASTIEMMSRGDHTYRFNDNESALIPSSRQRQRQVDIPRKWVIEALGEDTIRYTDVTDLRLWPKSGVQAPSPRPLLGLGESTSVSRAQSYSAAVVRIVKDLRTDQTFSDLSAYTSAGLKVAVTVRYSDPSDVTKDAPPADIPTAITEFTTWWTGARSHLYRLQFGDNIVFGDGRIGAADAANMRAYWEGCMETISLQLSDFRTVGPGLDGIEKISRKAGVLIDNSSEIATDEEYALWIEMAAWSATMTQRFDVRLYTTDSQRLIACLPLVHAHRGSCTPCTLGFSGPHSDFDNQTSMEDEYFISDAYEAMWGHGFDVCIFEEDIQEGVVAEPLTGTHTGRQAWMHQEVHSHGLRTIIDMRQPSAAAQAAAQIAALRAVMGPDFFILVSVRYSDPAFPLSGAGSRDYPPTVANDGVTLDTSALDTIITWIVANVLPYVDAIVVGNEPLNGAGRKSPACAWQLWYDYVQYIMEHLPSSVGVGPAGLGAPVVDYAAQITALLTLAKNHAAAHTDQDVFIDVHLLADDWAISQSGLSLLEDELEGTDVLVTVGEFAPRADPADQGQNLINNKIPGVKAFGYNNASGERQGMHSVFYQSMTETDYGESSVLYVSSGSGHTKNDPWWTIWHDNCLSYEQSLLESAEIVGEPTLNDPSVLSGWSRVTSGQITWRGPYYTPENGSAAITLDAWQPIGTKGLQLKFSDDLVAGDKWIATTGISHYDMNHVSRGPRVPQTSGVYPMASVYYINQSSEDRPVDRQTKKLVLVVESWLALERTSDASAAAAVLVGDIERMISLDFGRMGYAYKTQVLSDRLVLEDNAQPLVGVFLTVEIGYQHQYGKPHLH